MMPSPLRTATLKLAAELPAGHSTRRKLLAVLLRTSSKDQAIKAFSADILAAMQQAGPDALKRDPSGALLSAASKTFGTARIPDAFWRKYAKEHKGFEDLVAPIAALMERAMTDALVDFDNETGTLVDWYAPRDLASKLAHVYIYEYLATAFPWAMSFAKDARQPWKQTVPWTQGVYSWEKYLRDPAKVNYAGLAGAVRFHPKWDGNDLLGWTVKLHLKGEYKPYYQWEVDLKNPVEGLGFRRQDRRHWHTPLHGRGYTPEKDKQREEARERFKSTLALAKQQVEMKLSRFGYKI